MHLRHTLGHDSGANPLEYNFCLNHDKLMRSVQDLVPAAPATTLDHRQHMFTSDEPMSVLTMLISLGVLIVIHKTVIAKSQKSGLPDAFASDSRRQCAVAAAEMTAVLQRTDCLSQNNVSYLLSVNPNKRIDRH